MLEIGVYAGGSLRMWRDYFGAGAQIYGVDIEPECLRHNDERIDVVVGDQSDRSFWKRFVDRVGPLDVVIDDGGHLPDQQIASFESLLPHVAPGGVYACEDVGGVVNPFQDYVNGLVRNLHHVGETTTGFQQLVESVHLYPFVAVLERPAEPIGRFRSSRFGSEWVSFDR